MDLPDSAALAQTDAFIVTGSSASAYWDEPWIAALHGVIRDAHALQKRLWGSCFGHQIINSALGGRVERNRKGMEFGHFGFVPTTDALFYLAKISGTVPGRQLSDVGGRGSTPGLPAEGEEIHMLYIHSDLVTKLGRGLRSMGGTRACPIEATFNGENVLTFQGHPEFDQATMNGILDRLIRSGKAPGCFVATPPSSPKRKTRGFETGPTTVKTARESLAISTHSDAVATCFWQFLAAGVRPGKMQATRGRKRNFQ
jgi:GMP synthase-like glutamine amidotransferase